MSIHVTPTVRMDGTDEQLATREFSSIAEAREEAAGFDFIASLSGAEVSWDAQDDDGNVVDLGL